MTITLQPQNFTIKALGGLLQSAFPNGAIPGAWQLADGHYVPAKMTPVIVHPRPDAETNSWERHRMAPEGIAWSIPIVVQGGAAPFNVTVSGPAGMVAERVDWAWGPRYWRLRWPTPALGTHTVTVTVRTQEYGRNTSGLADEVSVTFTLTVAAKTDTTRFIFVDIANGQNYTAGATGSFTQPFKHFNDWYRANAGASFAGRQVFYRAGTYPVVNGAETSPGVFDMTLNNGNIRVQSSSAPMVHIGYPGETVVWNCSDPVDATSGLNYAGKWVGSAACTGLYVQNVQVQNGRQDAADGHFFWLTLRSNEKRVTLFDNRFINLKPGASGADNASVLFGSAPGGYASRPQHYAIIGNYATGLGGSSNGVSLYDLYGTEYIVAEGNEVEDSTSRYIFWHKADDGNCSVRGNVAWTGISCNSSPSAVCEVNSDLIELTAAPAGLISPIEVCWNRFRNTLSDDARRYTIGCDLTDATNKPTNEYHVYRNTVGGMIGEEGSITANSSVQSNAILRNAGQSTAIKAFSEITPANNVTLANGDLDASGLLTGTARTTYLGTHGAEIA